MKKLLYILLFLTSVCLAEEGVDIRVLDVGNGFASVIKVTDAQGKSEYAIFDTGYKSSFKHIQKLIPKGSTVKYLIISHTDSDHISATPEVCAAYKIKTIIRTGWKRKGPKPPKAWTKMLEAIKKEVKDDGAKDINQSVNPAKIGTVFELGGAKLVLVSGYGKAPADWGNLSDSEERTAIGIVIRLVYSSYSVLFCGDSMGADEDGPGVKAIATEKTMLKKCVR